MPLPPLPPGLEAVYVERFPEPAPAPTESWLFNYSGPKSAVDDRFCVSCSAAATGRCPTHGSLGLGCATCKAALDRECSGHAGFEAAVSKRPDIPAHVLAMLRAEVESLPEGMIEVEVSGMKVTPELASSLKIVVKAPAKR